MHPSKLDDIKKELKDELNKNTKLLEIVNELYKKFPNDIPKKVIDSIHELSFLRILLAWESFLEKSFIYYMLGEKTTNGYAPTSFVKPKDETHAYKIIKAGHKYPDWLNLDFIKEKSELFFENGEPFKTTLCDTSNIKGALDDMKTLRNAIVHSSVSARGKYENLLREKLGVAYHISPGEFLQKMIKNSNETYFTYFKKILDIASDNIIR